MYPVTNPKITSVYGKERTLPDGVKDIHSGIDFISQANDRNLYAICDGVITDDKDDYNDKNRWNLKGKDTVGNRIVQKSVVAGKTYFISYYHMATNCVSVGDTITKGQIIGVYGDVGYSFGAHVHLIVWDTNWKRLDPSFLLEI
jgi:murein DD-endopeptidase MepM/ murein hydrolase activator NlpD